MDSIPDKFSIKTISPEISTLIQNRLFENGYQWASGQTDPIFTDRPWLTVGYYSDQTITCGATRHHKEISLDDFFTLDLPPLPKEIKGFPWDIKLGPQSVKIGCQSLTRAELDTFIQQVQEKRGGKHSAALSKPWYIETFGSLDLSTAVQKQLISLGWQWTYSGKMVKDSKLDLFFSDGENTFDGYDVDDGENTKRVRESQKKITVEELFATESEKQDVPFNSLTVSLGADGLSAEGRTVSWEDFDKFVVEIKE